MTEFEEYLNEFLRTGKRPSFTHYKSILGTLKRWLEPKGLTLATVDKPVLMEYFDYMKSVGYRNVSRYEVKKLLLNFQSWHMDNKMPDTLEARYPYQSKMDRIRKIKFAIEPEDTVRLALDISELNALYEEVADRKAHGKAGKMDFAVLFLGPYFGMRSGEWLRIRQFDDEKNFMAVLTEKTQRLRILPFDDFTKSILKPAIASGWMSPKHQTAICKKYEGLFTVKMKLNVKFVPKSFRKTANTNFRNKWRDDSLVKFVLGHRSKKDMTDVYDSVFFREVATALQTRHYLWDVEYVRKMRDHFYEKQKAGVLGESAGVDTGVQQAGDDRPSGGEDSEAVDGKGEVVADSQK
jgi:integrase